MTKGKRRNLLIMERFRVIAEREAGGTSCGAADVWCTAAGAELPGKTADGGTVSPRVARRLQAAMELLTSAK